MSSWVYRLILRTIPSSSLGKSSPTGSAPSNDGTPIVYVTVSGSAGSTKYTTYSTASEASLLSVEPMPSASGLIPASRTSA